MKYIRFAYAGMVLFSASQTHSEVAAKFAPDKPLSAGQAVVFITNPECYGSSQTLGLKSDKDDTARLWDMLSAY